MQNAKYILTLFAQLSPTLCLNFIDRHTVIDYRLQ